MPGVPNDEDISKITESMNYFNLSHLSSRDPMGKPNMMDQSNLMMESQSSKQQMNDGESSPHFGENSQNRARFEMVNPNKSRHYTQL